MLVKFAIDPCAINNDTTVAHIRRLLARWEQSGVLVSPTRDDGLIKATCKRLQPGPRKHWETALGQAAKNNGNVYRWASGRGASCTFEEVQTSEALARLEGGIEVALLEETRAEVLEIPIGESKNFGEVEGVRLYDLDICHAFQESQHLACEPIRIGEQIDHIWARRFQRLAEYARNVAVVDQHAVLDYNIEGMFRLLKLLDQCANGCHLAIYAGITSYKSAKDIEARLRSELRQLDGKGINSLRGHLFSTSDFGKFAHDRHIRFDSTVCGIGRGLRIFEHDIIKEHTEITVRVLPSGEREEKERNLDKLATPILDFSFRVSPTCG